MDETVTTPIGTLEWNMSDGPYVLVPHLKLMRPTIEEDLNGKILTAKQFDIDLAHHVGDGRISDVMVHVAICAIRYIWDDGMRKGPILLCFTQLQLHWNVMIRCDAYKV